MLENTVSRKLLEINMWKGDWKSWLKLRIVASSVVLKVLSLQSSPPSHRLKAFPGGSWDPHVIAASRISQKSLTHSQRRAAWEGTAGGLGGSLNMHRLHTLLPTPSPPLPRVLVLPLYFPTQLMLRCAPEHPPCRQRGVLGSSTGLQRQALSLHTFSQGYRTW